jgi:citrate synthase
MYYETSLLDAQEGIRIRGFSLPELQAKLPTFKGPAGEGEPIPEALIWLLLTSEIPNVEQTKQFTAELRARATLPAHIEPLIRSLPKTMHPMTQLSIALLACQTDSKFAAAYAKGVNKSKYWESTLEVKYDITCYYMFIINLSLSIPNFMIKIFISALKDVLDVMARLPEIAALIYRCSFKDGKLVKDTTGTLDYSASFNRYTYFIHSMISI